MRDHDACLLEVIHVVSERLVLLLKDVLQVPDGPWALVEALEVRYERVGELLPGIDGARPVVVEPRTSWSVEDVLQVGGSDSIIASCHGDCCPVQPDEFLKVLWPVEFMKVLGLN